MPIIRSLWTAVAAFGLPLEPINLLTPFGSPQPNRTRPTTLLLPRSNGKPKAATAVHKLLMMGMRMPETCWAVFKRRAINLRDWCIWLVWFIWIEQLCLQELFAVHAQWSEQVLQKRMKKISVCQGSNCRPGGLPEHASCHSNKAGMSVEVGGVGQISWRRMQTTDYRPQLTKVKFMQYT